METEPQISLTLDLPHREVVDLERIIRLYLQEHPEGEAVETARRLHARLEPKTRVHL